jgi:hypothetical protein
VAIWGGSGVGELAFTLGAAPAGSEFVEVVETESCFELITTGEADGGLKSPDVPDGGLVPATGGDGGVETPKAMGLEGKVDCATGELEGIVRGVYYTPISVCGGFFGFPEPLWYPIKGKLTATYDPVTRTFKDGVIDLQEPLSEEWKSFKDLGFPVGDAFGGKGTWMATLDPQAPKPEPVEECYDEAHYKDFELDPNAHP